MKPARRFLALRVNWIHIVQRPTEGVRARSPGQRLDVDARITRRCKTAFITSVLLGSRAGQTTECSSCTTPHCGDGVGEGERVAVRELSRRLRGVCISLRQRPVPPRRRRGVAVQVG